jgi:hypothetical protein
MTEVRSLVGDTYGTVPARERESRPQREPPARSPPAPRPPTRVKPYNYKVYGIRFNLKLGAYFILPDRERIYVCKFRRDWRRAERARGAGRPRERPLPGGRRPLTRGWPRHVNYGGLDLN